MVDGFFVGMCRAIAVAFTIGACVVWFLDRPTTEDIPALIMLFGQAIVWAILSTTRTNE